MVRIVVRIVVRREGGRKRENGASSVKRLHECVGRIRGIPSGRRVASGVGWGGVGGLPLHSRTLPPALPRARPFGGACACPHLQHARKLRVPVGDVRCLALRQSLDDDTQGAEAFVDVLGLVQPLVGRPTLANHLASRQIHQEKFARSNGQIGNVLR